MDINLNDREVAVILAALRTVQQDPTAAAVFEAMPHFDDIEMLDDDAIDALCQRINDEGI